MAASVSYKVQGVPGEVNVFQLGSAADPAIQFGNPNALGGLNDGIYGTTTPSIGISLNGSEAFEVSASAAEFQDGTAALPGITFASDLDTGLYRPAANQLGLAVAGAGEVLLTASALSPVTSDGNALGTSSLMWADLFLASGAVINFNNGDVTITHSANDLTVAGGAMTLIGATSGAATAALIHGGGTTATKCTTSTADKNFIGYWTESTATSGTSRNTYIRHYLSDAGGDGEALRAFTTVNDVTTAGGAHGAHISISFASTGATSGLAVACRNTLHIANAASPAGGTYAATMPEIWSDGASSDPTAVTELSFIRAIYGGNATGIGLVDDKAFLIVLDGGAIGSGNIVESSATEANYAYSIRCKINGTTMYLMAASAVG